MCRHALKVFEQFSIMFVAFEETEAEAVPEVIEC
jgi:hypothetical protein